MKAARHDANDAMGGAVDDDVAADGRRIGVVAFTPHPVADHDDACPIRCVIAASQGAPEFRWNAQQLPTGHIRWTTPSGRQYLTEATRYPI